MAACTALVCGVQCSMAYATETWPLTKPNLQRLQRNDGNDQTDLRCQAARRCHISLAWRIWSSSWRRKGCADMNTPVVQSRLPVTYRLMESVGLRGQRWHGSSWQRGITESGSWLLTPMIDIPGNLVCDLRVATHSGKQGKQGKWWEKNSLQGKIREFEILLKTREKSGNFKKSYLCKVKIFKFVI